jgi:CHRD domain
MKSLARSFWIGGLVLGLTGAAAAAYAADIFTADLIGGEEVPPISTNARGFFVATVDDPATTIAFSLVYFGLEGGAAVVAHIHFGTPGVNGGVSAFLCGGGGKPACPADGTLFSGTIVAADVVGPAAQGITAGQFGELVRAMRNGNTYANVHNSTFGGGEIRGQIR